MHNFIINALNQHMLLNNNFLSKLKLQLQSTLPGLDAQLLMAPSVRKSVINYNSIPLDAVESSVLILLYPFEEKLNTIFIQRQSYNGVHSGQISFPGGRKEATDTDFIHTALREAQEEVNIDPQLVQVLGSLTSLYIPPSNFVVYPVVGYSTERPHFIAQQSEVAGIIEASVDLFLNPELKKIKNISVRESSIKTPCFEINGHTIWGATAMILSELKAIIESVI